MMNFADALNTKMDDIERPQLPPVGHYRFRVTKLPESTTSSDGKWDIIAFLIRIVEPQSDVDVEDYKGDLTKYVTSHRFMFNKEDEAEFEKSLFRLRTFLEKHLLVAEPGASLKEALNNCLNAEFIGQITWREDKQDKTIFHANISGTAPVNE